jgi:branched-subunit amino acid transport protein
MIDRPTFWLVVVVLGIGTYLVWLVRSLRYTAVAVLPALVAPAVLWPPATAGALDPVRLGAIAVTVLAGVLTRNMIAAIGAGGVTFYLLPVMLGAA